MNGVLGARTRLHRERRFGGFGSLIEDTKLIYTRTRPRFGFGLRGDEPHESAQDRQGSFAAE